MSSAEDASRAMSVPKPLVVGVSALIGTFLALETVGAVKSTVPPPDSHTSPESGVAASVRPSMSPATMPILKPAKAEVTKVDYMRELGLLSGVLYLGTMAVEIPLQQRRMQLARSNAVARWRSRNKTNHELWYLVDDEENAFADLTNELRLRWSEGMQRFRN